jgi:hypothetical protein
MILDEWQEQIINDKSPYILLCKGRQIGGTSTYAEKSVKWMREYKSKILVGSITEEQAKLVIVMVYDIARKKCPELIAKGKNKPTLDRIRFTNGAEIRSRPVGTMGDAFRGFTANVNWFNEASKWPEIAFTAIMPTLLTTGGEIWMDSTPFGKQGFFYRCFENKDGLWKVYYKSSEDVIFNRPLNTQWTEDRRANAIRFLMDQKKEMSELQYGQEYLGLFLEELRRFFDDLLIDRTAILKRPLSVITNDVKNYLGVDIARMGNDESTFEVVAEMINQKKFRHLESQITKKQLTTQTEARIIEEAIKWKVKKIGIDAGAGTLGVSILDHLLEAKSPVKNKVVAINNRSMALDKSEKPQKQRLLKEDLYNNLKSMLEHGELLLLDDEEVKMSMRSIQYEFAKTKSGESRMVIFGNYSHVVEGLIRAAWLAKKEKSLNVFAL